MNRQMYQNQFHKRPIIIQPQKRRRKRHFRWEILALPALILFAAWLVKGTEIWTWDDFLDYIGIHNKARFTTLFVLGVLACTICAIARVLNDTKKSGK